MTKGHITTKQIDELVRMVNKVRREWPCFDDDEDKGVIAMRRLEFVQRLHQVTPPAARPYAGLVVVDLAIQALRDLDRVSREYRDLENEYTEEYNDNYERTTRETQQQQEIAALRAQVEQQADQINELKAALSRKPGKVTVEIPAEQVLVRSEIQQEALRLMGEEGLGRAWRIQQRIQAIGKASNENSVRNALRQLTEHGLIEDYEDNRGKVKFSAGSGGAGRLVVLTEKGRIWYKGAFGKPALESELITFARRHQGIIHAVGILEARDNFQGLGYVVNEAPEPLISTGGRWGTRAEPDLMLRMDGHDWPVEVQRKVSDQLTGKWAKTLALAGRLVLVLFNEDTRIRQENILRNRIDGLPDGEIRLVSLEAMAAGDWNWTVIHR